MICKPGHLVQLWNINCRSKRKFRDLQSIFPGYENTINSFGTADQETRLADREEMSARHQLLVGAMKDLTERERDIIQARRLQDEPATLEELSQKYGVSRERVRQIEVRAFEKLQRGMQAAMQQPALPAPA